MATRSIKLEYFNIVGVAEKVRLALVLSGTPFEDVRLSQQDWAARKPTARYGQVPILTLPSGDEIYQSDAMLRWAGAQGDGALYPSDPATRLLIDEIIGVCGDMDRNWRPCIYLGMRPEKYGHAGVDAESKGAIVKTLREAFVTEDLPLFAGYFSGFIERSGGPFLAGSTITIADLQAYNQLAYFTKGIADHIPADCLTKFPAICSYLDHVQNYPPIKAYYASKA